MDVKLQLESDGQYAGSRMQDGTSDAVTEEEGRVQRSSREEDHVQTRVTGRGDERSTGSCRAFLSNREVQSGGYRQIIGARGARRGACAVIRE